MVKVAAAQISVKNDTEENLDKIIKYIGKAANKKVDIVCFPETSLIKIKNKGKLKKLDLEKYLDKIKKSCKENKIHCIIGSNVLRGNKVYNSSFLINDKGAIVYTYDKVNLWINEKNTKFKGLKNKAVNTKFGKIGLIICWDIAFPEYVKKLGKQGAWIIFCPSYVINYNKELGSYEQLPYARAFENTSYFVYVDAYAKDTVQYSYICGPSKIYSKIRRKEGMIIANLDHRKILGLRKRYGLV
jgi:predicted amidohydrolase